MMFDLQLMLWVMVAVLALVDMTIAGIMLIIGSNDGR